MGFCLSIKNRLGVTEGLVDRTGAGRGPDAGTSARQGLRAGRLERPMPDRVDAGAVSNLLNAKQAISREDGLCSRWNGRQLLGMAATGWNERQRPRAPTREGQGCIVR